MTLTLSFFDTAVCFSWRVRASFPSADQRVPGSPAGLCPPARTERRLSRCREGGQGLYFVLCHFYLSSVDSQPLCLYNPMTNRAYLWRICTLVPYCLISPPQTREQLQAELSSCQAKIIDLEKALVERGQVTKTRDGDRSSRVVLSLALLHVCLVALLLGWRYADQVCRRFLWCHFLHVWCHSSMPARSASSSILPVFGSVSYRSLQCWPQRRGFSYHFVFCQLWKKCLV